MSTYGKRQREQQKRDKAKAKVERRTARHTQRDETDESEQVAVDASQAELIQQLAGLHLAREAGQISQVDFEEQQENIRRQLEQIG